MKLEVIDLKKHFGEKEVLKGISFTVENGQPLGLLGQNGAGKTTTIRTLMGIYDIEHGEILLDGKPFNLGKESVGYLPEERGLYQDIKVIEQLVYIAKLRGLSAKDAKRASNNALAKLEISHYADKLIKTLSKGNQQKVQLAQTIVHNPKIVILDEPFSGLDPVNSQILKDVILELIAANKIVIFSSHQMNFVEEFCKDIVIIKDGAVVLQGDLEKIKQDLGGNRLVIKANGDTNVDLVTKLHRLFGPTCEYKITPDDLIVTPTALTKNELISRIAQNDIDLRYVKMYEPSLHDIFVAKVGEDEPALPPQPDLLDFCKHFGVEE
ncbi:MAG: hypothetical protein ATN33_00020 [Epulopiscium sp. Nele67-Bin001]|nr:MAG: hypothetical protein ATN33_00020 [Epulopiscium sp. Nele67-Bin001]